MSTTEDLGKIIAAYFDAKTEELEDQIEHISEQINALHAQRDKILATLGFAPKVAQPKREKPSGVRPYGLEEKRVLSAIREEMAEGVEFTCPQVIDRLKRTRPDLAVTGNKVWEALATLMKHKEVVEVRKGRGRVPSILRRASV